ncbi:MAG: hypothetical protein IPM58_18570 [Nitrospira sp.]|nr:hypothetical protein [Nitrospira sp.]
MKRAISILLFLAACTLANAAEPDVLVKFFGHAGIGDKRSVYHGEMLKHYTDKPTVGQGLPRNVQATFRKLEESQFRSVYAVLLSDGHKSQDWYAFLVKENDRWKISAVRNLALSGVFHIALQQLEQKNPRSEKEEWQYQNMLLTIKSDRELKEYLKSNLADFRNVVTLYSKGDKEQSDKMAKRLLIDFIKDINGAIEFNIGGIIDNTVGYLYVPPGSKPPTMDPSEFIYVEEIADGWYIYKTT